MKIAPQKQKLFANYDYNHLKRALRECRIPVTIRYGDEVVELPQTPQNGTILYEDENVTILEISAERGGILLEGVEIDYYSPEGTLVRVRHGATETNVEGVTVKLPTIFDRDCSEVYLLARLKRDLHELEKYEPHLCDFWSLTRVQDTTLKRIADLLESVNSAVLSQPKFEKIVKMALPNYAELLKTVRILLTDVTYYGYFRKVAMRNRLHGKAPLLYLFHIRSRAGYTTKRLSGAESEALSRQGTTAVFVEDGKILDFLRQHGIEEVSVNVEKPIAVYTPKSDGELEKPRYMPKDALIRFAVESNTLLVDAEKVTDFRDVRLPGRVRAVKCNDKLRKELKVLLGDAFVSKRELLRMLDDLTIVTDGRDVYTLSEIEGKFHLLADERTELLPYLNTAMRVYAVVTQPYNTWRGKSFKTIVKNERNFWTKLEGRIGAEGVELIYTFFFREIQHTNPIYKHLVRLLGELTGIEPGMSFRELTENYRVKIGEMIERRAILRYGYLPTSITRLERRVGGLPFINPLSPMDTTAYSEKVKDYWALARKLGFRGAAIFAGMDEFVDGEEIPPELTKIVAKYVKSPVTAKKLVVQLL